MSEEKNVMIIPSEKSFSLTKVKLLKEGGLDVHYEVVEVVGMSSYNNKYHVESAKDIHPDLARCFTQLVPIMGRIFNITSFLSMIETPDFKATKEQKNIARDFAEEALQNIEIRGVSLSGKDDNVGVVITGLFTVANGYKTAINSPRIKFNADSFGFEEELENIISEIEQETYLFLFKGKKAQLELFDPNGEPTPEADNGFFNNENDEEYSE